MFTLANKLAAMAAGALLAAAILTSAADARSPVRSFAVRPTVRPAARPAVTGFRAFMPAAQARTGLFNNFGTPMASIRVAPSTAGLVNPNFLVAPGLSINQYAYNTALLGRAYSQVPPYLYGYNPYPQYLNYGSMYSAGSPYNPYLMNSYGTGLYSTYPYGAGLYAPTYPYYDTTLYPDSFYP